MKLKTANITDDIAGWAQKQDFTPGLVMGGLSAAGGALATGERDGENPRQRAMRMLRNAAAAGLIGGTATQMIATGAPMVDEVVRGGKESPGFFKSVVGRSLAPLGLNATGHIRRDVRSGKTLKALFGGIGEFAPDVIPAQVNLKNPGSITNILKGMGIDQAVIDDVLNAPNREGKFREVMRSKGIRPDEVEKMFNPTKGPSIGFNSANDFTGLDSRFKDISKQFREMGRGGQTAFDDYVKKLVSDPAFRGDASQAGKYLHRNYGNRFRNKVDRAIFPRATNIHNPLLRAGSRVGGVAGMAGLFVLPEAIEGAKRLVTSPDAEKSLGVAGAPFKGFDMFGQGGGK